MKILMVNKFHYRFGGAETYYFGLSDLLRSIGHTVIPFAMRHPLNQPSEYERYFVDNVDYDNDNIILKFKAGISSIYSVNARKRIKDLINLTKPDIVHIHNYNYQITPSIFYEIAKFDIPVVQTLHDPQIVCPHHRLYDYSTKQICERCKGLRFHQAVIVKCIKSSYLRSAIGALESYFYHSLKTYKKHISSLISPSIFLKNKIEDMGLSGIRVEHIPNFVYTNEHFSYSCPDNVCLYVGRLSYEKGLQTLIKSMDQIDSGELWVVGDGPIRPELEKLSSLNNQNNVRFLGQKKPDEVRALLRKCAFTVVPSEWYENLPLSVMESFAEGKSVIASNLGGLAEMVTHGKTGLLFPAGDVNSLASSIKQLFESKELQKIMGLNAHDFAEKTYGKKNHLERILGLYNEFLTK